MPRRRRFDRDPEINAYLGSWHRAQTTILTALGLLVAWAICAYIASHSGAQPSIAAVPRLFATYFGWGAIIIGAVGLGRLAYAYFYPPWREQERDRF